MKKSLTLSLTIVIILAAIAGIYYAARPDVIVPKEAEINGSASKDSGNPPKTSETNEEAPSSFARLSENAIYISDQWPGSRIILTVINLAKPVYVIIYKQTADGYAGPVVAISNLIRQPEIRGMILSTPRPIKDGDQFIARLYFDDGDESFEEKEDELILSLDDKPLEMSFKVDASSPNPETVQVMF